MNTMFHLNAPFRGLNLTVRIFFLGAIVSILAFLVTACATTDYAGKTYPATTNVDVFFSLNDVGRPYEVMGKAKTEGSEYMRLEDIEAQLVKDAMKKGADAIFIEGMDEVVIGSTSSTSGNNGSQPKYVVTQNGEIKNTGGTGHYSSFSSSTTIKDKVITAQLLKYKQ